MKDVSRNSLGVAGAIVTLVAIGFGRTAGSYLLKNNSSTSDDARITESIARTAIELEKKTPLKINAQTTLVSVVSADKTLLFSYKVAVAANQIDVATSKTEYWAALVRTACRNPATLKLFDVGGSYRFIYNDERGMYIMGLTIDRSILPQCKSRASAAHLESCQRGQLCDFDHHVEGAKPAESEESIAMDAEAEAKAAARSKTPAAQNKADAEAPAAATGPIFPADETGYAAGSTVYKASGGKSEAESADDTLVAKGRAEIKAEAEARAAASPPPTQPHP